MVWVFKLSLLKKKKKKSNHHQRLEKYVKTYPLGLNYLIVSFSVSWRINT